MTTVGHVPPSAYALRQLLDAWSVNLGRAAIPGEAEEFRHAFVSADPATLRRAIDEYATGGGDFLRLAGLRAVYSRIAAAAGLNASATDEKARERDAAATAEWFRTRTYEAHGFRFTGESSYAAAPAQVREMVARHSNESPRACAPFGAFETWTNATANDAREVMRVCRDGLARIGFDYEGRTGAVGCGHVEWDMIGGWWIARAMSPRNWKTASPFARGEDEYRARMWTTLLGNVDRWNAMQRGAA